MRTTRVVSFLIYPILATLVLSGCQSLYEYKPVPVLVRDAETQAPIPGAEVHLSHPLTQSLLSPCDSSGKTGMDGIARLKAATFGDHILLLEANAPGHMAYVQDISEDAVRQIKSRGWFEAVEQRPPAILVEMYAEPRFFIDLVIPLGYRGLVKATVQLQDDVPWQVGQRGFRFDVGPSGDVHVLGPSLLKRYPPIYQARYADGTRLTEEMDLFKVGFRWLKREDQEEYFAVGTQADYDRLRREWLREPNRQAPPRAVNRGSRKGGRRRGAPVEE